MDTLLIVGGSGLLGAKLAAAARDFYEVVATHRGVRPDVEGVRWVELNKEKRLEALDTLRDAAPDLIVDTAAFHNVDKCEEEKGLAWKVNAVGTHALAREARERGARYCYVSTDFVFDGEGGPYREGDPPVPRNYYAITKLVAEQAVLGVNGANQVVRPSVIYGWDATRLNFATWVLTSLREGETIRVVTDWVGSPTFADSLAEGLLALLRLDEGGVFHLAGPDCLSRYDFAVRLAKAFDLDSKGVHAVTSDQLNFRAERPARSCLANERAAGHGIATVGVEEGIATMRAERDLESFETPERFKS